MLTSWSCSRLSGRCYNFLRPQSLCAQKTRVVLYSSASNDLDESKKPKFFVTTPIFYVNADPHLGHLYSATIADALHRFKKIQRPHADTIFSTGTDEHGLKIQQAANNLNKSPLAFCDGYSVKFRKLFDSFGVSYTHFVRTTDSNHLNAVHHFLTTLMARDYIYKGDYAGWYCVSDESFLTESQVTDKETRDGIVKVSTESGHRVEWNSETNYKFKLSQLEADLTYWLKDDSRVKPRRFLNDLRNMVSRGLLDLSVSRPRDRVSWGAPFPKDDLHTVYVWVDALVNYLTAAGYPNNPCIWPPDVQVLGKDILHFHGVYWPSLLMAAGLEPPRQLMVHSHWTVDGVKMSKSLGNVVCPDQMRELMTAEGVRYLLLRQGTPHADGSWRTKEGISRLNSDLADTLGNLIHRCTGKSLNRSQIFPALSSDFVNSSSHAKMLLETLEPLKDEVAQCYDEFNFFQGIDKIMGLVRCANLMVHEEKPWTLKDKPEELESVLHLALSAGRAAAIMLLPVVPLYAARLLDTLAVPESERTWDGIDAYPSVKRAPVALGKRNTPFKKINIEI